MTRGYVKSIVFGLFVECYSIIDLANTLKDSEERPRPTDSLRGVYVGRGSSDQPSCYKQMAGNLSHMEYNGGIFC